MARYSMKRYQIRVLLAMAVYIALLLLCLPLARSAEGAWLKVLYALAPVLPLLYVITLMARRIRDSDELEQRTHLIGLGAASAVVSVFSLVSGFLAVAKVLTLDACALALIWIFPVLMVTYAVVRGRVARRYGGSACDHEEGLPAYLRFSIGAALFAVVAAYAAFHARDEYMSGLAAGMAAVFASSAIVLGIRRWVARRRAAE